MLNANAYAYANDYDEEYEGDDTDDWWRPWWWYDDDGLWYIDFFVFIIAILWFMVRTAAGLERRWFPRFEPSADAQYRRPRVQRHHTQQLLCATGVHTFSQRPHDRNTSRAYRWGSCF